MFSQREQTESIRAQSREKVDGGSKADGPVGSLGPTLRLEARGSPSIRVKSGPGTNSGTTPWILSAHGNEIEELYTGMLHKDKEFSVLMPFPAYSTLFDLLDSRTPKAASGAPVQGIKT